MVSSVNAESVRMQRRERFIGLTLRTERETSPRRNDGVMRTKIKQMPIGSDGAEKTGIKRMPSGEENMQGERVTLNTD